MSTETPEAPKPGTQESQEDRRLEDAGSTPLPSKEETPEKQKENTESTAAEALAQPPPSEGPGIPKEGTDVSVPSSTAQIPAAPQGTVNEPSMVLNRTDTSMQSQQLPLSLNKLAIFASAQNKLPVSKVKGIVLRLGRHTESSLQKSGKWHKTDNYVDKDSYTWRNMPLFEDHQTHLWTPSGTVRSECKK